MLARAFAHGFKPAWIVGDQVYGGYELRSFLEGNQRAYVLGIPAKLPSSYRSLPLSGKPVAGMASYSDQFS